MYVYGVGQFEETGVILVLLQVADMMMMMVACVGRPACSLVKEQCLQHGRNVTGYPKEHGGDTTHLVHIH